MTETPRKSPIRERKGKNRVSARKTVSPAVNNSYEITLEEALELFVNAKKAEGMRLRTIHDYYQHIEWFRRFLSEFYPDVNFIQQLTADLIRNYINYLKDERNPFAGIDKRERPRKGLAVSTINIRLRTLCTMCRFWAEEGYLTTNPMEKVKLLKSDSVDDLTGFTEKELKKLFGVLDTRQYSCFRDKVIMLLLLDTGIRINELVNIEIQHLDVKQLTLTIPAEIAKNRRSRTIPVSRKIMKLLLELHKENKSYFEPTDYLFLTAYGDQAIPDTFRRRLYVYAKEAKVKRATPHMFRHTFARDYLLNGGDIFTLQLILDHADITTTRRYIQMNKDHVQAQHRQYSPASKYLK
ncbi:tyrosine-type recombinase/integrase [Shimazuella kribbensis]|uniref:tyrosine-type recombinase/integrase n=1 Tax=Shimazuella kribbensis TaxID=139808 RepID=UPI0003F4C8A2|nr:tyrosine-type recombinase/integrase [Shimazuella kribbensis]